MTSRWGLALVLICAGWLFLGNAATFQALQTEADHKLLEKIKAEAEKNDPGQQCALGEVYFSSKLGVPQDYAKAVYWFRKAAEQGYDVAQYHLEICYYKGDGVAKDAAAAVKWYRMAAEQGMA